MFLDCPHLAALYGFSPYSPASASNTGATPVPETPIIAQEKGLDSFQNTGSLPNTNPAGPPPLKASDFDGSGFTIPNCYLSRLPGILGLPIGTKPRVHPLVTDSDTHVADRVTKAVAEGKQVIVFLGCGSVPLEVFAASRKNPNALVIGVNYVDNWGFTLAGYTPSSKNDPYFSIPLDAVGPIGEEGNFLLAKGRWFEMLQLVPDNSVNEIWAIAPVGHPGDSRTYSTFSHPKSGSALARLLSNNGFIRLVTDSEVYGFNWGNTDLAESGLSITEDVALPCTGQISESCYLPYSMQFANNASHRMHFLVEMRKETP